MEEQSTICPYTGLRPFTEDESLYFKGRDEHIDQATKQLEKNKFIMLTGASGDGKSSLVYAGIIPNARAGFLKSQYTQWCVADFRPERTPFKNLAKSLARELEISNSQTIESELTHGFSALIDLYRNSKRFVDSDSVVWKQANETGRAALKREAANLIILVDQFEEFFTNPENYHRGVPSSDSNLVLNLLLETTRIALDEDLPIYVIFTMRSDFIGQCAAFRGLPEYIGFSQFFVPRLNRSQLQQVIEEPAVLSGNKITRRLTERLIHDLTEGVDQLPIIQHALNQVWHAADNGKEEMDLVHYAMVGGMPANELPEGHADRFNQWFSTLPSEIKSCYHEPDLQNVLDTHTNKLYEQAADYYLAKTGKVISQQDAKAIIKTAFICLTKIDQSRAVRNRMTLREISNILARPEFGVTEIGAVLNIFREPGNTFIRPFILDNAESQTLKEDTILDITHESLIRNWAYLEQWAKEEFDNYMISLDYEQQLARWVESKKAKGFLLSIGPLTYFENWANKVKPNIYWIARYLPEDIDQSNKLTRAQQVLDNSQEFLQRSARKHAITRTVMRYGPGRIAAALGVVAALVLSSFAVRDYYRTQNDYVLKSIHNETLRLAANPKATYGDRMNLVVEELRLQQTTVKEVIDFIEDPAEKLHVAMGIATRIVIQGRAQPKKEIFGSLQAADSLLNTWKPEELSVENLSKMLRRINQLRVTLELAYMYNPDSQINEWRKRNAERSAAWATYILEKQPVGFHNMQDLNLAIEHAINLKAVPNNVIDQWLAILSPFERTANTPWLNENYQADKLLIRGSQDYGFRHNGLYQLSAYLYASKGNAQKTLQCMDTLLANSQYNYQADYAAGADNAAHIAATYFTYGHSGKPLDEFVAGYCQRKKITEENFYSRLIGRSLTSYQTIPSNLHLYWFMDLNSNLILQCSDSEQKAMYFNKYRSVIGSIKHADERNFLLAWSYKNEGILKSLAEDKSFNEYFDKALEFYRNVSKPYLEQQISVLAISGSEEMAMPRKFLFTYPDIRWPYHPLEPRGFMFFYYTDSFMKYVLKNNLFNSFYGTSTELSFLSFWLRDYHQKSWVMLYFTGNFMSYDVMQELEASIAQHKDIGSVDLNFLHLYAGYEAQMRGDTTAMLTYYRRVNSANLLNLFRSKEYAGQVNGHALRLTSYAVKAFVQQGRMNEAHQLMAVFKKPINRSSLYAFAATRLQLERTNKNVVKQLMDSATIELGRVKNLTTGQPHRQVLAYAMTLDDPDARTTEANLLIKNLLGKSNAQRRIAHAHGFHSKLYSGLQNLPPLISDTDQSLFYWWLLYGYEMGTNHKLDGWQVFDQHQNRENIEWIGYIDENN